MASVKRSALGKGLSALIEENSISSGVNEVEIMRVEPSGDQPRKNFDKEKLEDLAESIKQHGMIQPIIVRQEGNSYRIIAGERRWRAAWIAGLKKVPVIIREVTDRELHELALIENIQREDLNPIEEAEAYRQLVIDYKLTQEELAGIVGNKSRSEIANRMRLLNLDQEVKNMLIEGKLLPGQARPLLALPQDLQAVAAKTVIEKGMSARQVEAFVKKLAEGKSIQAAEASEKAIKDEAESVCLKRDIEIMQGRLRNALGTKVKLDDNKGRGKIVIEYYSADERERLLEYLLGSN
ncbi:MAG: ParB/RepB/Spo0J family partition protein [Clostridia bacterium]|nr:ParB/RepB/Spo0J family partition protein [Clostridia bacterium]